jgi:hypothetical protein
MVSGQKLSRAKGCDFSSIVAGTYGYLRAHFYFSQEWDGCKKVAVFSSQGKEYPVALQYNFCKIPEEALHGSSVQVYVVGRREGYQITTDVAAFPQLVRR